MQVPMNPAESFINWMVHHTDLYIRGERGKSREVSNALYSKLFKDLQPFFTNLLVRVRADERLACRKELCEDCAKDLQLTPDGMHYDHGKLVGHCHAKILLLKSEE